MCSMLRSDQLLYPQHTPATPRAAATLLLVRDAPTPEDGWQVLMSRRSAQASFVPGAYVFPGGSFDAQDADMHSHVLHRPSMQGEELTAAIAAVRESFEEMGVLIAVHADGRAATQADIEHLDREAPLWPQLAAHGLQMDLRDVWLLAHWTADRSLPKRFAVHFFVVRMPQAQTPVPDEFEQFEAVWVEPTKAVAAQAAGEMFLIFPTIRTLQRLSHYRAVPDIFAALQGGALWHSTPRGGFEKGQEQRYMESDGPFGEVHMVSPDGQVVHHLDWQHHQPVALRRNVLRLTASNGGVMTGPGTNSYLVGTAASGFLVIDPGPDDAAHVQRLWQATGGNVRAIVCTHSHPDHSPGAALLQNLCAQHGSPRPLVYGMASAATAQAHSLFQPDVQLQDGDCIAVTEPATGTTHTLRAIYTPGHAANHVCLLLQEDGLLFSGDHILNGSTTIISGPDGNMDDYLRSLDKLDAVCAEAGVEFVLPAHGYVLDQARRVIAHLKAHRLAREAKVLAAMQQIPQGQPEDWVPVAYADTPRALWPLAQRSLIAHVERIRALGLAHARH